ncbi:MAG: hypothetical protein KAY37_10945 [Phycisphaerae bacterium]|nr:hypothetical protein [Phycisphaerae bacterium]
MNRPRRRHRRNAAALISAVAILLVVAAFAALLISVHTVRLSTAEAEVHRLRAEAAALAATQLTLWEVSNDADLKAALARVVYEGDTSFEADPLFQIQGDLAGAAFHADVWPGDDTVRLKSRGTSGGAYYDRWAHMPMVLGGGQFETGFTVVGGTRTTVTLRNKYVRPVVVCSVQYRNNSVPVVPRVSGVTNNSFMVRLQNPSDKPVKPEKVCYLVMEEGVWTIGDLKCEAQTYTSTVTDHAWRWKGEKQSYGQDYKNPVVVGQVMTENDPDWSVFWCYGKYRGNPPSSKHLRTGKSVCEDNDRTRADETVGFIVFEKAHGTIAGVEFEAALGPDTIRGVQGWPPYPYWFKKRFSSAPQVALVATAGLDGSNGGWAQIHGATLATRKILFLAIDEDQIRDKERSHTTEQVGYIVFESSVAYP